MQPKAPKSAKNKHSSSLARPTVFWRNKTILIRVKKTTVPSSSFVMVSHFHTFTIVVYTTTRIRFRLEWEKMISHKEFSYFCMRMLSCFCYFSIVAEEAGSSFLDFWEKQWFCGQSICRLVFWGVRRMTTPAYCCHFLFFFLWFWSNQAWHLFWHFLRRWGYPVVRILSIVRYQNIEAMSSPSEQHDVTWRVYYGSISRTILTPSTINL